MSTTTFDDFSAVRALESAGAERDQAEAVASALAARAVTRADFEPLTTKADLASMRAELTTIRWEIGLFAAFVFAIGLRVFSLI